jgi:hypothetical protein
MSETAATAFLGFHLALLVLGFGLPALALELSGSEAERRVILRHRQRDSRLERALVGLCGLCIASLLVPLSSSLRAGVEGLLSLLSESVLQWARVAFEPLISSASIVALAGFGWLAWDRARKSVFHVCCETLTRGLPSQGGSVPHISDPLIDDLVSIAIETSSRAEKKLVVDSLFRVCWAVGLATDYDGKSLAKVLEGVMKIVENSERPEALLPDVLRCVSEVHRCIENRGFRFERDGFVCRDVVERVTYLAIRHGLDYVAIEAVRILPSQDWALLEALQHAMTAKRHAVVGQILKRVLREAIQEEERLRGGGGPAGHLALVAEATVGLAPGQAGAFWRTLVASHGISKAAPPRITAAVAHCTRHQEHEAADRLLAFFGTQAVASSPYSTST